MTQTVIAPEWFQSPNGDYYDCNPMLQQWSLVAEQGFSPLMGIYMTATACKFHNSILYFALKPLFSLEIPLFVRRFSTYHSQNSLNL